MSQFQPQNSAVTPSTSSPKEETGSLSSLLGKYDTRYLPAYFWGATQLSGFNESSGSVDLAGSDNSASEVFRELYPNLNFAEVALSADLLQQTNGFSFESLFKAFGYNWNAHLEETLQVFLSTPNYFKIWSCEKSLSLKELQNLKCHNLKDQDLCSLLLALTQTKASKSLAAQILGLMCELYLMKTPMQELLLNSQRAELWLQNLQSLRYPMTTQRDTQRKNTVKAWSRGRSTQLNWVRKGDQAGLDIQIFSRTPEELEKQIESLKKNLSDFKKSQDES